MAITDDLRELRKNLSDPTPLYFAAGTADLAVQQALKVPALLEHLAAEAPERIEGLRNDLSELRNTDPKAVQERVADQAKEAQATVSAKVNEVFAGLNGLDGGDLRKLGETAQDLALRGVGVAAEYAVKARETYERVAEHGEQTVRTWRGEAAEEITEIAVAVEPEPAPRSAPAPGTAPKREAKAAAKPRPRSAKPAAGAAGAAGNKTATGPEAKAEPKAGAKKTPAPRRAPAARRTAAKKTNPPAK
ncbi:hypothetical protein [Streptomyces qinzhouensis]|uniref:Uncharacterized protein n=1 Tax=Streptomyces qinzhouensis TaxID=2599401 RepID=A0A5B8IJL1_9ACTN|nr:hypothetical protein [Streptomyces qinzhouensis]QDY77579.1 hypothetical protein FQU76_14775 [Streptomyces qinzhouensis]